MSRFHGSADRAVGTRRKIITPGPMMANVTTEAHQELRTHHRDLTGGKYYPGIVDDNTMFMDEFDLVFMFKDCSSHAPLKHGSPHGSHTGYPVFSVFNGIKGDKFWLYQNVDLVGINKTHTNLNDRGTGTWSQTAIFRGGSASVIHTGTTTIPMNNEFKVVFYDAVNDPKKFHHFFREKRKLYAGRVRVTAIIEPYHKHDDIAMMLRHYHPHTEVGSASRPGGHSRPTFGKHVSSGQNTSEHIIEKIIKGSAGCMLLGYLIGRFMEEKPTLLSENAPTTRGYFKRFLTGVGKAELTNLINVLYSENEGSKSGLGEFVATMMFPQAAGDKLLDKDEQARRKSGLEVASFAQEDATYLYPAMKELRTWERKWVVGLSMQTAHPNGVMDIIIRR